MDNATRRQLLDRAKSTGFPGDILDVFAAYDQGKDIIQDYVLQQQGLPQPPMQVAETPEEQGQGLRPYHEQGQINQSMAFPNVQPGQSFNTMGMKVPINIDKVDKQGNLVESYKAVPPGIANLPTGPYEGTVIESPARMKNGGVRKYQTGNVKEEEDKRTLESGTIVDKGTNTLNIVKGGKITKTFPVLTGQAGKNPNTDVNRNVGSLDDLETNPAGRSTPTGTYMMAPNPNVYGWPGYDLNPIAAFGQNAPDAENTAVHITYGADPKPGSNLEGHPDPAEFRRRNAAYTKDSNMRYLSYGCTNAQGEAINCLEQTFPQGDTAIYVDSRFNKDSNFLNRFRTREEPTAEVVEEPIMAQQPNSKPVEYVFDPEFGTMIKSPIEVTPRVDGSKSKSKAKKKETGGSYNTNQETSMYEWRSGRPEESRKRYFVGGLKNRVLYNKAKYKR